MHGLCSHFGIRQNMKLRDPPSCTPFDDLMIATAFLAQGPLLIDHLNGLGTTSLSALAVHQPSGLYITKSKAVDVLRIMIVLILDPTGLDTSKLVETCFGMRRLHS